MCSQLEALLAGGLGFLPDNRPSKRTIISRSFLPPTSAPQASISLRSSSLQSICFVKACNTWKSTALIDLCCVVLGNFWFRETNWVIWDSAPLPQQMKELRYSRRQMCVTGDERNVPGIFFHLVAHRELSIVLNVFQRDVLCSLVLFEDVCSCVYNVFLNVFYRPLLKSSH